jgi:SAM-dependent methyltransferase
VAHVVVAGRGRLMLRDSEVPTVMARVETALTKAARSRTHKGPVYVYAEGDDELGIASLRKPAVIKTEFQSGSARPVVGPTIRFVKRAVRRSLRWYVAPMMEQQTRFNNASLDVAERLRLQNERLMLEVDQLRRALSDTERVVDGVRADFESGLRGDGGDGAGSATTTSVPLASTRRSLDYRSFEDRHRGAYDDIRKLLSVYVPHFRNSRRVLDIGCGRGEFLRILRDEGIDAYGVDSDETMVEACKEAGLEVVLDDAVAHMRTLDNGAIDGIFCSQVAEHLQTWELMALLDVAHRKLAPGGVIVFETPNPESLFIFHSFFYVDLTHIRPIHPEAMRWAFETTGFTDVSIERVLPLPDGVRLDDIPEELHDDPAWFRMATNIVRLNAILYGPQHYVAVGYKEVA